MKLFLLLLIWGISIAFKVLRYILKIEYRRNIITTDVKVKLKESLIYLRYLCLPLVDHEDKDTINSIKYITSIYTQCLQW